jgi:alcohol dehydrogenase class IV
MDSMILAVTIFLLGCFAATIGSLLGLGGGVFIVPGLLYIQHLFASMGGITPQIAVGTSLLVVAITALRSTWAYTKQKRVDYGSGLFFFAASGPGVLIGAYMNRFFDEQSFYIVFGLFLLLMFYFMMRNKKMHSKRLTWHVQKQTEDEEGNLHQYGYHRYLALAICLFVGLLQGLLGIGGGSCLDMAKCVAVLLAHGGRPQDYYGEYQVPGPVMPLMAIPTTAGTGSEVTPVAVLSDADRNLKVGISSPFIVPTISICDPELTVSCPASLTAIAGADALTHAIEAYTAIRREPDLGITQDRVFIGKNALSDHFALRAIALIWQGLEAACRDGEDIKAREKVMMGATLAGLSFGVAGTAAAHAIQYPVGAQTGTPHGAGVACLMPYVMAWNAPTIRPELDDIATAAGLSSADEVIPALAALFARIGIPPTLRELGLAENQLDWVVEQSSGIVRLVHNNPRPLAPAEMRSLVRAAYSGDLAALQ